MKKLILLAALVIPILGMQKVWAVPITGSIEFSGTAVVSGPSNNVLIDFNSPVSITSTSGDYNGAIGAPLNGLIPTFNDINFNDTTDTLLNSPLLLYSFISNGDTYSFTLTGITEASVTTINSPPFSPIAVALTGFGFAEITGKDKTYGTFALGGGGLNKKITFTAANSVPDGGATVFLLGAGLLGLAFAGHRFSVRSA